MRNNVKYARVKRDYLIRLAIDRYRLDTDAVGIARFIARGALQRDSSRFSSAKSDSTLSRARISTARPPLTITSHGRGREL